MHSFNNILILIEDRDGKQTALTKGLSIAAKTQARVTILLCTYEPFLAVKRHFPFKQNKSAISSLLSHKKKQISDSIARYNVHHLNIEILTRWAYAQSPLVKSIVEQSQYDLVVKCADAYRESITNVIFSDDNDLMKTCPCPILLTSKNSPAQGSVLCALNTDRIEPEQQGFNWQLATHAYKFARLLGNEAHLLSCYLGESTNMYFDSRIKQVQDPIRQKHFFDLAAIAQILPLKYSQLHVMQGHPDHVIPKLANDLEPQLLVLGMHTRDGLFELLFGHTLQGIVSAVDCDILAIQPNVLITQPLLMQEQLVSFELLSNNRDAPNISIRTFYS